MGKEEATALIGAHTIGLLRNTFGSFGGPWVPSGADNATPEGPIMNNEFHDFLKNGIAQNNVADFVSNPLPSVAPFTIVFPDWFKDQPMNRNHLDTDVVLAFPSNGAHPDYAPATAAFANDNAVFLSKFFQALQKMSSLGVT